MKLPNGWKSLICVTACLWPPASPLAAQETVAVLSSNLEFYRASYEAFLRAFSRPVSSFTLPAKPKVTDQTRVIVAFGTRAALLRYPPETPLIYCLAPVSVIAPGSRPGATVKISMTPKAAVLLARLRELQPDLRRLAIFWISDVSDDYVEQIKEAGMPLGLTVVGRRLRDSDELPEGIRALAPKPDALWMPPDPLLITPESFGVFKEYSWSQKIPLYAPSAGFARKGVTASLFVDFEEMGRLVARAVQNALDGRPQTGIIYPEHVSITVNLAALTHCGLRLDAKTLRGTDHVLR